MGKAWFMSKRKHEHRTAANRIANQNRQSYIDNDGVEHKVKGAIVIACQGECEYPIWD